MRREAFIALAIISLVAGASIPLIANSFLGGTYKPAEREGLTVVVYQPSSPYDRRVSISLTGLKDLRMFSSYEELARYLNSVMSLNALISRLYGYSPQGMIVELSATRESFEKAAPLAVSKTNVQVEGIDEPDVVKTNGRLIAVASDNKVFIVGTAEKAVLSVLIFSEPVKGLFLYENKLAVITETRVLLPVIPNTECRCLTVPPGTPSTNIYLYNIERAENPILLDRVSLTGMMLGSRLSGNYLYVVASMPIEGPVIPTINERPVPLETLVVVDPTPDSYTLVVALDLNELSYAAYTFLTGSSSWLYMSHGNLYLARETRLNILDAYILVLKALTKYMPNEVASEVNELAYGGRLEEAIEKAENYLLSLSEEERNKILNEVNVEVNKDFKYDETTFYVFSVNGLTISPKGSFNVPGRLLDQFAMEELNKRYFIVATTESNYSISVLLSPQLRLLAEKEKTETREITIQECSASGCTSRSAPVVAKRHYAGSVLAVALAVGVSVSGESSNNVFIIDLTNLRVASSLRGLARGERIYSARLVGSVFFLVTFRQVDPLFAIDVSNPEEPRVLGFLKIPGFSEYLHPLPRSRLLGIGVEGSGLKISLFDVSDPANMREVSNAKISPAWSPALHDHRAVTVYLEKELVIIPFSYIYAPTSGALVMSYKNDTLKVKAVLQHENCLRTVYIGEELYTISPSLIKIFNINTYEELGQIVLK